MADNLNGPRKHTGGSQFHYKEVEIVVRERLRMQEPDFYASVIFKLDHR
jgi:hypothetical protein